MDLNRNAFRIVKSLTSEKKEDPRIAVARLGGLKGGAARAAALTPARRQEIAVKANQARWKRKVTSAKPGTK